MRAQPDPEQQNLFSVAALAVVPAKVGRRFAERLGRELETSQDELEDNEGY